MSYTQYQSFSFPHHLSYLSITLPGRNEHLIGATVLQPMKSATDSDPPSHLRHKDLLALHPKNELNIPSHHFDIFFYYVSLLGPTAGTSLPHSFYIYYNPEQLRCSDKVATLSVDAFMCIFFSQQEKCHICEQTFPINILT